MITFILHYWDKGRKFLDSLIKITWMDLDNIMLSEISQSEKAKNHMI